MAITNKAVSRITDGLEAVILNSSSTRNNLRAYMARVEGRTLDRSELEPEHAYEAEAIAIGNAIDEVNNSYDDDEPEEYSPENGETDSTATLYVQNADGRMCRAFTRDEDEPVECPSGVLIKTSDGRRVAAFTRGD